MTTKIKGGKIFSDGNQSFNVPNNDEGKAFVKALRKFSNPKKQNEFHCRGRGSRIEFAKRAGRFSAQSFLPLTDAEWIAIYMDSNAASRQALVSQLHAKISQLQPEIVSLQLKNKELQRVLDNNQVGWNRQVSPDELKLRDENLALINMKKQDAVVIEKLRKEIETTHTTQLLHPIHGVYRSRGENAKAEGITITVPVGTKINVVQA